MSSLCSLSTSSNSTSHLWGIIMLSPWIIQLYQPFLKTQPSSALTFNSFSGFPSAAVSHPRCWKPASCSAGFQDLNQNFWHSIHIAHWALFSSVLLWVSIWGAWWCFLVSNYRGLEDSSLLSQWIFFALHVSSISISECGLQTKFRTLTKSDYSGERKITSLSAASFCWDRIAPVF